MFNTSKSLIALYWDTQNKKKKRNKLMHEQCDERSSCLKKLTKSLINNLLIKTNPSPPLSPPLFPKKNFAQSLRMRSKICLSGNKVFEIIFGFKAVTKFCFSFVCKIYNKRGKAIHKNGLSAF